MSTRTVIGMGAAAAAACILASSSSPSSALLVLPPLPPPPPGGVVCHRNYRAAAAAAAGAPSWFLPRRAAAAGRRCRPLHVSAAATGRDETMEGEDADDDDEALLRSVDASTLQSLCEEYSLPAIGSKEEMLARLRGYANDRAEEERERRRGRRMRIESNLEGGTTSSKARHKIVGDDEGAEDEDDDGDDDDEGFFYYSAPETEEEKRKKEEERRDRVRARLEASRAESSGIITAPPPPEDLKPNADGERTVTVYSTTEDNDLTGMTAQNPAADVSLETAHYRKRNVDVERNPGESLAGGPFGDASSSGARGRREDEEWNEKAAEEIRGAMAELLATTGAPAFLDDDDDEEAMGGGGGQSFASPYGFVGFQPERVPPGMLSGISPALRADDGRVLREVISDYELQAIGHDGMAADDKSQGGGHYRVVVEVGSFLEGYRRAEERRVARETATMMLDRLAREGVGGLDSLLSGMSRGGGGGGAPEAGELNAALGRYLDEAIREQEKRVKSSSASDARDEKTEGGEGLGPIADDTADLAWNVTRGEDGTVIETFDPNDPAVSDMLREELERSNGDDNRGGADGWGSGAGSLLSMTVQEKMLLLLKLLRDRVKVEAAIGNDQQARNLRILAYCLRAGDDDERRSLITDQLGNSIDSLDVFSDLVTASIDYAEARSNDDSGFTPGRAPAMLDKSRLRNIKAIVERVKASRLRA